MRYYLIFLFCWFSILAFGQGSIGVKTVSGDTSYWNHHRKLFTEIKGKDFLKSTDDFNFRYTASEGYVLELTMNEGKHYGKLINYIYQYDKKSLVQLGFLLDEVEIDTVKARKLIDLVSRPKFMNFPTDDTSLPRRSATNYDKKYSIEYADLLSYHSKSYWNPYLADSMISSHTLLGNIERIESILNLDSLLEDFKSSLSSEYTYSLKRFLYPKFSRKSYMIGWTATSRFPYGLKFNFSLPDFKKFNPKMNSYGHLRSNFDKSVDFEINFLKGGIGSKKKTKQDYSLVYGYRHRSYHFDSFNKSLNSHHLTAGHYFNKITIGASLGLVYQIDRDDQLGIRLVFSDYFMQWRIGVSAKADFFKNEANFRIRVNRNFRIAKVHIFGLGIGYEKFQNYHDILFNLNYYFYQY